MTSEPLLPPCVLESHSSHDVEPALRRDAWREIAHWQCEFMPSSEVPLDADIHILRNDNCIFGSTRSSAYDGIVTLAREGNVLRTAELVTDIAPGATATFPMPFSIPAAAGEYTVDVEFTQRRATRWAPANHVIATGQAVFTVAGTPRGTSATALRPTVITGGHNIGVRGDHFIATFSKVHGGLSSYRYGLSQNGGRELLKAVPQPNFWHAPTSNERGYGMPSRDGAWLLASRYPRLRTDGPNPTVVTHDQDVEVIYRYEFPTTPTSTCDVSYRVSGSGRIEITATLSPGRGLPDLPEFGMLVTTDAAFRHLRWYGEGPDECYVDRRSGARLGVYEGDVRTQLPPYVRPQESGSRTGVRWATVTDDRGTGLRVECPLGDMEFSALPWTPFEIENAAHPTDLPPINKTVLRPAMMRRGVGGDNSWGAETHPEFLLPRDRDLVFRFALQGIR